MLKELRHDILSRFQIEKFSLNFSIWLFVIRVNLCHPKAILVPFCFIFRTLVFFYLTKLIFCDFPHIEANFAHYRKRLRIT